MVQPGRGRLDGPSPWQTVWGVTHWAEVLWGWIVMSEMERVFIVAVICRCFIFVGVGYYFSGLSQT